MIKKRPDCFNENSSLLALYLFLLLPFVILVIVKCGQDKTHDLLLVSYWPIASNIIYGHLIVKLIAAIAVTRRPVKVSGIAFNIAFLVCIGLVVNAVIYALMLVMPSKILGATQIILFVAASVLHFVYGSAVHHISRQQ